MKWPEFVDVVGQAEQKCLFALGGERTARCFSREFAFDCAEDRLGMHTLPITLGGESRTHLRTHSMNLPARLASFGRNDTLRANLFADVPVVAFAVELGISQNGPNGAAWNYFIEQRSQGGAVIDRSLVSLLCEDHAQTRINSHKPFEPVTPWHRSTAMLLPPTNEKRAGEEEWGQLSTFDIA